MAPQLVAGRVSNISVVLFTDIENSVKLRRDLGDDDYGKLKDQHDLLFESLMEGANPASKELFIKSTGDGFLKLFKTAADAVRFSLLFQHALTTAEWNRGRVKTRIGINIGDVAFVQQPSGPDVSGIAVDIAARVMSLAQGGQILLTPAAFNSARHNVKESGLGQLQKLKWVEHGAYVFQGWDMPMEVFEVGVEGVSPLRPPPASEKAAPLDADKQKKVIGWRPAEGQSVEGKPEWVLEHSIGAGGFGEAWLATHRALGTHTVFKFCFDNKAVESLQRETHIFRTLRKELGERGDIAKLIDVRLEGEPPYYLQSDYAEGGDLRAWSERQGGIGKAPFDERVRMIAQIAEALGAAHSVGVLHKDIKPANILMDEVRGPSESTGIGVQKLLPKLSDFGIGEILDSDTPGSPRTGSSGRVGGGLYTTTTGISPYIAPEVAVGGLPTTASDVYSVGVLLYQIVAGDLSTPFGSGWERDIEDPILRGDIASCTDKDPSKRIGAGALAANLRNLAARHRTRRRRRMLRRWAAIGVGTVVGLAVAVAIVGFNGWLKQKSETDRQFRIAGEVTTFLTQMLQSADPTVQGAGGGEMTLAALLDEGHRRIVDEKSLRNQPEALATVCQSLGNAYLALGRPDRARDLFQVAVNEMTSAPKEPEYTRLRLALAEALLDSGSTESIADALKLVEAIDAANLGNAENASLCAARGRLASSQKKFKEAATQFEQAEKFYALDESLPKWKVTAAQIRRARMLFEAEQYSEAIEQADKLARGLAASGGAGAGRLLLDCQALSGRAMARIGRYDEAVEKLTLTLEQIKATEKAGGSRLGTAYAYADLADALERAGKSREASQQWQFSRDIARGEDLPPSLKAYFNAKYGLALMNDDKGLAIEPLEAAIAEFKLITSPSADDEALRRRAESALESAKQPGNDRPRGQ